MDVLAGARELVLEGADGEIGLEVLRVTPAGASRALVALAGIDTRERAAALVHASVMMEREVPGPGAGVLHAPDLPGRPVVEAGRPVGRVRSTYHNGAHDVIVVETPAGLVDFPLAAGHVEGLDPQGRVVVVGFEGWIDLAYPAGPEAPA
jgi:ribosomal 30S subunit maturation factor RimM